MVLVQVFHQENSFLDCKIGDEMKEITDSIDFADSSYASCETDDKNLIVYLKSWDDRILKITFLNMIRFIYRGGSFTAGLYEQATETPFLLETLSSYYENIPKEQPFKTFVIKDIEGCDFFEVIAEKVLVSKE